MIKVNLLEKQKVLQLPTIMGVDLGDFNFKGFLVVLLFVIISNFGLNTYIENDLEQVNAINTNLKNEAKKLVRENNKFKQYEKKVKAFQEQEKSLRERKKIVEDLINTKRNPMSIMLYISKNIPENLWVNQMTMNGNDFLIEGESTSYKSIGLFLESLQNSIFFEDASPQLTDSRTNQSQLGIRTEYFKITGKIKKFE